MTSGSHIIDPPFATKQEFRGTQDQKAYQDKIAGARFIEFLRKRLVLIYELLSADGTLYLHLDQRKAHYAKVVLDEVFGEQNFRNEIIWRNTNTHNKAEAFGQIHQSILLYTRSVSFYFRKTFRPRFRAYVENHYRHTDKTGAKFRFSDPTGPEIRAGESGQEWQGYNPTAKGRHWAIPGFIYDLVEDDISNMGVLQKLDYLLKHGFIELPEKRGGQPQIKRPASVGEGLYDFSTLKKLAWTDWRFFALQLFGCKDEPHTIGGLVLDGKLKGAGVLVFNHHENPGKRIDEESIQTIHSAVGKKIGRKFFIIAPRGVFDFQQDYVDLEGVRYYALRITDRLNISRDAS